MNINPKTNIKGEPITLEDRFLTAREVAEICGMSRATIYRAMERNQFTLQHQITEGRVGWLKSDIEEYMRVGFRNFILLYGEKIKQQRIDNKAAIAQANAA
ncbi:MAG: AlpA family phage regulatory protein [Colwellia sp.]